VFDRQSFFAGATRFFDFKKSGTVNNMERRMENRLWLGFG
jgi:hypothetical protein